MSNPTEAAPTARHDLYLKIHKALRAWMTDTLTTVGRMDPTDAGDVAAAVARVRDLLQACRSHLELENTFIHPALEACTPGSSARIGTEHVEHDQAIDRLLRLSDRVEQTGLGARAAAAQELYHQLALFVAENFEHMHVEETRHNATLWAGYTDTELADIESLLVRAIAPPKLMTVLRWMLPFVHHGERVRLLAGMRATAPAAAFDAAMMLARTHLRERDWLKLADALGLRTAAAPVAAEA